MGPLVCIVYVLVGSLVMAILYMIGVIAFFLGTACVALLGLPLAVGFSVIAVIAACFATSCVVAMLYVLSMPLLALYLVLSKVTRLLCFVGTTLIFLFLMLCLGVVVFSTRLAVVTCVLRWYASLWGKSENDIMSYIIGEVPIAIGLYHRTILL